MVPNAGANLGFLLFPGFGDTDVLTEVQEFQMEKKPRKVHIYPRVAANARFGLSGTGVDNFVVYASLNNTLCERFGKITLKRICIHTTWRFLFCYK